MYGRYNNVLKCIYFLVFIIFRYIKMCEVGGFLVLVKIKIVYYKELGYVIMEDEKF